MTDIANPFPYFPEAGTGGFIYVGTANMDPRTNPITVYRDSAKTIPWAQPIRTVDGYPAYQGSQEGIYNSANAVSLIVQNAQGHTVISELNASTLLSGADLASTASGEGASLIGISQTNSAATNVYEAITERDGGLVTINTLAGDTRLYVGDYVLATNATNRGHYSVSIRALTKTGVFSAGGNDIADTLIARYTSITNGSAWLRWDVLISPLNPASGLPGAPGAAQSFYMVTSEINPQNRHANTNWRGEARHFANSVAGEQMVAETQDFSALLPTGTRIGYDLSFGYALAHSPYTNSDEQRHARFVNGWLIKPNTIAADGACHFGVGFHLYPTAIAIANGGSAYSVGDLLTFNTGLAQEANENTVVRVKAVDGSGAITSAEIYVAGWYQQSFASPVTVTGGTGTSATFTYTMAGDSVAPRAWAGITGTWDYGIDAAKWENANSNMGGGRFIGSLLRTYNGQEIIRARNAADNADVTLLKFNSSNRAELVGKNIYLPQAYTPTFTASSGTFTTVTVVSARYSVINGRCNFDVAFQIANKGTATGQIRMTLPIAALYDTAVTGINSSSSVALIGSIVPSVSATRCNLQKYDSTDPIVDTNFYIVSGSYEVAS